MITLFWKKNIEENAPPPIKWLKGAVAQRRGPAVKSGGQGQSSQAIKLFRVHRKKYYLPLLTQVFHPLWCETCNYPTTVLSERMWHFRDGGVKTYSDPSYIFSEQVSCPQPSVSAPLPLPLYRWQRRSGAPPSEWICLGKGTDDVSVNCISRPLSQDHCVWIPTFAGFFWRVGKLYIFEN